MFAYLILSKKLLKSILMASSMYLLCTRRICYVYAIPFGPICVRTHCLCIVFTFLVHQYACMYCGLKSFLKKPKYPFKKVYLMCFHFFLFLVLQILGLLRLNSTSQFNRIWHYIIKVISTTTCIWFYS